GEPLPDQEKTSAIDWDNQKDFDFHFQIGLAGEFKVELSDKVKVTRNLIEVTEATVDEAIADARKRHGNISYPEVSGAADSIYGEIRKEGEEEKKSAFLIVEKLDKKIQPKFTGVKREDIITFQAEALSDDMAVRAQVFNVSEEEAKSITGTYHFHVGTISNTEPAELNQEFFDKVFGKEQVSAEADFRAKVRETIEKNYEREANHLFEHELEHHFTDHTTMVLPEEFLKRWLKETGDGKITDEVLAREFPIYIKEMKWNLIRERIASENEIKVEAADVRQRAKEMLMEQFGGAAIAEQLGDRMDAFADNYLQGNEGKNYMRLYNQLHTEKIMGVIRGKISVTDKMISLEDFQKLAASHRH
ncbi:MAG: trigger factor, partial [Bacteroidota bacterium]